VQPVLDKYCAQCHQGEGKGRSRESPARGSEGAVQGGGVESEPEHSQRYRRGGIDELLPDCRRSSPRGGDTPRQCGRHLGSGSVVFHRPGIGFAVGEDFSVAGYQGDAIAARGRGPDVGRGRAGIRQVGDGKGGGEGGCRVAEGPRVRLRIGSGHRGAAYRREDEGGREYGGREQGEAALEEAHGRASP